MKERLFQFSLVDVTLSLSVVEKRTLSTKGYIHHWNNGNNGFKKNLFICKDRIQNTILHLDQAMFECKFLLLFYLTRKDLNLFVLLDSEGSFSKAINN